MAPLYLSVVYLRLVSLFIGQRQDTEASPRQYCYYTTTITATTTAITTTITTCFPSCSPCPPHPDPTTPHHSYQKR
ncbi:hypothetical protein E2C01_043101 [Portunus trituberculatus]|uniref:Secreted protein n=1 Tax=Portunus trituberculatus TaxID=210409 RepID=A0A5B7FWD0_PORTR|nr:hypothetical protein [Portunus trituberculatus]